MAHIVKLVVLISYSVALTDRRYGLFRRGWSGERRNGSTIVDSTCKDIRLLQAGTKTDNLELDDRFI